MSDQAAPRSTQEAYPWVAVLRTLCAALLGFLPLAPVIWRAATGGDPAAATGWAATALAICAGATRVMAIPQVNDLLRKIGLAAEPPR